MSGNLRSRTITEGVQRSPNRAMLRAVGFGDRDFEKPIVGVANAYSTITPCNVGLDGLARSMGQLGQLTGAAGHQTRLDGTTRLARPSSGLTTWTATQTPTSSRARCSSCAVTC